MGGKALQRLVLEGYSEHLGDTQQQCGLGTMPSRRHWTGIVFLLAAGS